MTRDVNRAGLLARVWHESKFPKPELANQQAWAFYQIQAQKAQAQAQAQPEFLSLKLSLNPPPPNDYF